MGKLDGDTKKVGEFLKELTELEIRYLQHCMNFVDGIKTLISKYKLEKDAVVGIFHIEEEEYDDYVDGNYDYTVKDISLLQSAFRKLEDENN